MYVQVADPRGDAESALPKHRDDAHVLRPVLDPDDALVQQVGKRGVHDQFGCGLVLDCGIRCGTADLLRALGEGDRGEQGASRDYNGEQWNCRSRGKMSPRSEEHTSELQSP